jgi:hypothetical protein
MYSLSVAGMRTGLIRRWHATMGLVAAAAMTVAAMTSPWASHGGALGLTGFAGFVLWLVWIVTYGVRLVRTDKRTDEASAPQPMAAIS